MSDIVPRLRAVLWYEVIRALTGKSDDELDEEYLAAVPEYYAHAGAGRMRAFRSVGYLGTNPDLVTKRGISLVSSVSRKSPQYRVAEEIFRAIFWRLCSLPRPEPAEIAAIIGYLLNRLSLYRATDGDAYRIQNGRSRSLIALTQPGLTPLYQTSIKKLAASGHIDALALLAALYQEAIYTTALEHAVFLTTQVNACVSAFQKQWGLARSGSTLDLVIQNRILKNRWDSPNFRTIVRHVHGILGYMKEQVKDGVLLPNGYVPRSIPAHALFKAYLVWMSMSEREQTHLRPIVPQTAATIKLAQGRDLDGSPISPAELFNKMEQEGRNHKRKG